MLLPLMTGILDLFIPKEQKFIEYLQKQVLFLDQAVDSLAGCAFNYHFSQIQAEKALTSIRKKSDESNALGKQITIALHQTFITPIDREELQALSLSIRNTISIVEKIATCLVYFKLKKLDRSLLQQIRILEKTIGHLQLIFKHPLQLKHNTQHIDDIKHLEREANDILGKASGHLFNNGHDPMEVFKYKELYYLTEKAIDMVQSTVDIVDIVLINNA